MNHKFLPSQLNITVCAKCKRNMMAHLPNAECEACGKCDIMLVTNEDGSTKQKSALEIVNDILMCRSCLSKELEAPTIKEIIPETITKLEEQLFNKPSDQIEKIIKSNVFADLPQNQNEFFNAEVVDHVALEQKIMNDGDIPNDKKFMFLAQQLQMRQQHLGKILLQVKEIWLETKNRSAAVHQDLNILAGRLRKEEREQLKIQDVSYVPSLPPKKVTNPRMKAEDKVIEGMAKLLFAPKINGIVQWEALEAKERENYMNMARNVFKGTKKEVTDLNANEGK